MKVLLLAAGRSKRAKPIEDKNFLRFCGKYLIKHQIEALKSAGFDDIIIVGGAHNLEKLRKVAQKYDAKVVEQKNLDEGMAGAVLSVEDLVGAEDLFIVSGNDVVDTSAYNAMKNATGADSFLLAREVFEYFPGGYLKIEGEKITGIIEKPGAGNEPSNLINLVLHLHKNPKRLFEILKEVSSEKDDRYEIALDILMKERTFQAVPYSGFWQALKFPQHVLNLTAFFLSKLEKSIAEDSQISKTAVINGNVVIESGVKIFDHAVIQGPAYIGKNSIVGNNALVRASSIGKRSVIGFNTEVARSYVGDDTWFHSNYIGDSIIGNNCGFGAGAICANLRLDEKKIEETNKLGAILGDNIRIGVNTSLMPGVKIGSNTMITSGLVIAQDIEAGKYVSGKIELKIDDNKATIDPEARNAMMLKLK
ncbi:MAG: NTP transferase domain-containing protein [Patescibacteria group bacterium]